jgi:hypothetical protein
MVYHAVMTLMRCGPARVTTSAIILIAAAARGALGAGTAHEVTFAGAGGFELRGTLVLPAPGDGARAPAVLLLPGSGPTDRDGNQPSVGLATNLLAQVADALADAGIASLRFDKRAAHVYAPRWPPGDEAMDEFFSYENFVGDARAAYETMRTRAEIDPRRVAIAGHSEGGLLALQIARDLEGSESRPAALALLATAGRTIEPVLREQIAALLDRQGADAATKKTYLDALDGAMAAVRRGDAVPADLPAGLRPLFPRSAMKLMRAYFTVDPALLAESVRGPVLVLQGDRDAQVSVERDAPRLVEALKKRAGGDASTLVVVEGASHNLKPVKGPEDPAFAGPVAPPALAAIVDFLTRSVAPR